MFLESKKNGVVYTPPHLVKQILDLAGYTSNRSITGKHVMDNSCGNGAFLTECVHRYCESFLASSPSSPNLKRELETYIHGIEIDTQAADECRRSLELAANQHGIYGVNWDIRCGDALQIFRDYHHRMDYVVGNPPYVRIHHLDSQSLAASGLQFASEGMYDLYLAFFEIGFEMLNQTGKLAYITPSSFLTSKAGKILRKYMATSRGLRALIDMEHQQLFPQVTTYTIITIWDNEYDGDVFYYRWDSLTQNPRLQACQPKQSLFIGDGLFMGENADLQWLKKIDEYYQNRSAPLIRVKNGFATLADSVFIGQFEFADLIIPVVKATTGEMKACLFPYNQNGDPLRFEEIQCYPEVARYLFQNKARLLARDVPAENWYLFGRSQALRDVYKDKLAVSTLLKSPQDLKISYAPAGVGVYSGLYLTGEVDEHQIRQMLQNEQFMRYVRLLRKYKRNGFYSFSAIDLEKYLYFHTNA